jgi:hypothetical protein
MFQLYHNIGCSAACRHRILKVEKPRRATTFRSATSVDHRGDHGDHPRTRDRVKCRIHREHGQYPQPLLTSWLAELQYPEESRPKKLRKALGQYTRER